jgi:hypothetical protein
MFYWKHNDKKPKFEHGNDKWFTMAMSLKPYICPSEVPAGYVRITEFSNISFVVDIEYKGKSTKLSKFWNVVSECPPCVNVEDYPYKYVSGQYYVELDENGKKFWCQRCGNDKQYPLQKACKFREGSTCTIQIGICTSRRDANGVAYWE